MNYRERQSAVQENFVYTSCRRRHTRTKKRKVYRGGQIQREFDAKKAGLPKEVSHTLSLYMSPTSRSRTLVMLRSLMEKAPYYLDMIEMGVEFFICSKQILQECDFKLVPGCILGQILPLIFSAIKKFAKTLFGALLPSTMLASLNLLIKGTYADAPLNSIKGVKWTKLVDTMIKGFKRAETVIRNYLPIPGLYKIMSILVGFLVVVKNNHDKGDSFLEVAAFVIESISVNSVKHLDALTRKETYVGKGELKTVAKGLQPLADLVIAVFGDWLSLFKDASLYIERYRPILNDENTDEFTVQAIWAAFALRIVCQSDKNICTVGSILAEAPGFWSLLETKSTPLMKLFTGVLDGTHTCFLLKEDGE